MTNLIKFKGLGDREIKEYQGRWWSRGKKRVVCERVGNLEKKQPKMAHPIAQNRERHDCVCRLPTPPLQLS
jgi:hypothetical protein